MANLHNSKRALSLLCLILIASQPFAGNGITTPERRSPVRNDAPQMKTDVTQPSEIGRLLAGMPLRFEPNRGQTDSRVKFLARGDGYSLFLTETEAVLKLTQWNTAKGALANKKIQPPHFRASGSQSAAVRIKLLGARRPNHVEPLDELSGDSSYFIGSDPSGWLKNVPGYARVVYREVYPGVDMIYYGNQGQLEYDFRLAPRTDPKTISLSFEGADRLRVDAEKNLVIDLAGGELRQRKPIIYQQVNGVRREVEGRYVVGEKNSVGFEVEDYDRNLPLLIDPVVSYSTYLGGSGSERPSTVAVDSSGNAYVTGDSTGSMDFPVTAGAYKKRNSGGDAYVTKIAPPSASNANATLIYSTYLGGRFSDRGLDIAVDSAGNAYISGWTQSTDFPVTPGAFQTKTANPKQGGVTADAFITKLNASGSALLYSSYLGGAGDDFGDAIVSSGGFAFVAGETTSTTKFPTKAGFQTSNRGGRDAFIAKVDTSVNNSADAPGSLVFSSYLGGGGWDRAADVTADSLGNAYLTGETSSTNFPTANPYQATLAQGSSAFVSQVASPSTSSTVSSLAYSTYLSGSGSSWGGGIAIREVAGQLEGIYVVGTTQATDFPLVNPYQSVMMGGSDVFVTKFDPFGASLVYSTYIGGNHFDDGVGIAIDSAGNAYVTGDTKSNDFPIVDAFQPTFVGGSSCGGQPAVCADAFVSKLTSDGSTLVYSSFLGGNGWDGGFGVAVDSAGCATVSGWTHSTNFQPIMNQLLPNGGVLRGSSDAFLTRLCPSQ